MSVSARALVLAFAAGMVATAASAQSPLSENYRAYISGAGGINMIPESSATVQVGALAPSSEQFDFDMGWAAAGAVGMFLPHGFRVEVEGAYRHNKYDTTSFVGGVTGQIALIQITGTADGTLEGWSAMVNAIKDIDTGSNITPYLGAGVGVANRHLEFNCNTPLTCSMDDKDSGLAYQGIAGISVALSEQLQLFADYRYFATSNLDYTNVAGGNVSVTGLDDRNHTVMLGLRLGLGKKAPPPAPVVQAPAPKNYLVFFDFDQSVLTAEAKAIIAEAAKDAQTGKATRLDVTGHTDRSGSDAYNLGLSERRANAVKAELIALGVPESAISVTWRGESEPLVATEDGVREPQNRRASIMITYPAPTAAAQ